MYKKLFLVALSAAITLNDVSAADTNDLPSAGVKRPRASMASQAPSLTDAPSPKRLCTQPLTSLWSSVSWVKSTVSSLWGAQKSPENDSADAGADPIDTGDVTFAPQDARDPKEQEERIGHNEEYMQKYTPGDDFTLEKWQKLLGELREDENFPSMQAKKPVYVALSNAAINAGIAHRPKDIGAQFAALKSQNFTSDTEKRQAYLSVSYEAIKDKIIMDPKKPNAIKFGNLSMNIDYLRENGLPVLERGDCVRASSGFCLTYSYVQNFLSTKKKEELELANPRFEEAPHVFAPSSRGTEDIIAIDSESSESEEEQEGAYSSEGGSVDSPASHIKPDLPYSISRWVNKCNDQDKECIDSYVLSLKDNMKSLSDLFKEIKNDEYFECNEARLYAYLKLSYAHVRPLLNVTEDENGHIRVQGIANFIKFCREKGMPITPRNKTAVEGEITYLAVQSFWSDTIRYDMENRR